ncbi:MAG TPA: hypothetical protein VII72_08580 [Myxococcota bacterium]
MLGGACLCSEPLRFTAPGTLFESADPPDSEGVGAKECAGGNTIDAEPTGIELVSVVDNASDVDFPLASDPPAYVLKMTAGPIDVDNGWRLIGETPQDVVNETVCSRTYQRFGNDLPIINDPMRAKLQEAVVGGMLIQHGILQNDLGQIDTFGGNCTGSIPFQAWGRTQWIRHEACLDIGTTSMSSRQRATLIETGVSETVTCGPFEIVGGTPTDFESYLVANLFLQADGNAGFFGSRYVTHGIQTRVPFDANFWPGPAIELEDGDGDGVANTLDDCLLVANSSQDDTDSDGYGNRCDADYDDNGAVNSGDYATFLAAAYTAIGDPAYDPEVDTDSDGTVGPLDFSLFKGLYLRPPGPSGLACAGSIPCTH